MAGEISTTLPASATPAIISSLKPHLVRLTSPSFQLRSPSLNSVRLRRVFDLFDGNGDGEISVDELSLALDRLGLGIDLAELSSAVASYVQPGHLGLDFDSFSSLHRGLGDAIFDRHGGRAGCEESAAAEEEEENDMREAFRVFDENGDGFISAKELQAVLGKLGLAEGRCLDRVHRMIGSVDRDSDGRVDFLEFKIMMKTIAVLTS
ncbi:Calcium-binding protein CML42 [Platanthera guangdongensis]|uniref:Calcium-binding protein CML42 n=1 Tax=Platanthera guangdongensis TaxID=2320717 RepID=A0ABR2ME61_9ASPA